MMSKRPLKQIGPTVVWACLALLLWGGPVSAQGLTAAADDAGLWLLSPEPDRPGVFTLQYRAHSDPPTLINKVQTLRGDVRPNSVAARDHTLWVYYPDGEVQAITAEPSILQDGWTYRTRVEPSLPTDVTVRAAAASASGPWALVRVEDHEALRELEAFGAISHTARDNDVSKRRRNLAIGLPPGYGIEDRRESTSTEPSDQTGSPTRADTTTDAKDDKAVSLALPVDRLLQLEQGHWRVHPLPEDWAHGARAWLVAVDGQSAPTLITRASGRVERHGAAFDVYHHVDEDQTHWQRQTYTLDAGADQAGTVFVGVESQLVGAQFTFDGGQLWAELSVLRGGKVLPVGRMTLRDVASGNWGLLGTGNTASLVARPAVEGTGDDSTDAHLEFVWTQMDLRGNPVLDQTGLAMKVRGPMDDLVQYLMLAFIAVLVTVLMLAFWRRDAAWNKLELPDTLMVADLGRRAIAAAIDMAPGMLGAMFYFGLNFEELMLRWPGNGLAHTLEQVTPGSIVIAAFVTHTTVSELCFARTLGKLITGLRTTALDGSRPKAWQLLVRGLLKILDLIPGAWLLLMLPVIAPHRQRLGDLVGRTVVVSDAPPVEGNSESDDPDDWSD
ncbi:MAG: RDD family protein [Phycisphaerales bacterium]